MSAHPEQLNWASMIRRGILVGMLVGCFGSLAVVNADEPAAKSNSDSAITLVSATAPANVVTVGPVVLAYKFKSGQFVHYSGTSNVRHTTQLGDQYDIPPDQRKFSNTYTTEAGTHFRVVTVDEQGIALIEPVVDRTRMTAKMHGKSPVEFDSTKGDTPEPQFQAIRDAIGRPVARFQVDPTGKLIKAVIIDATAPQRLREAAEKLDTRFAFLALLPSTPVSVGDKWREDYSVVTVNKGLKQPLPMRRIYELTSIADGIATIGFKTLVMTPVHDAELEKQIMQQTPSGTVEFDIQHGLVRSYVSIVDRTVMNAFGAQSLFNVTGESTEKLVAEGGTTETTAPKPNVN